MTTNFLEISQRILNGGQPATREEALAMLTAEDFSTFTLVEAAGQLRRHYFSNTVKINYLVNLKSGLCPEDCTYCSQRLGSEADILKYTWIKPDEAVKQAGHGIAGGASRVCMVASGKGPTNRDVERVAGMVESLKEEHPEVEVCACLGILKEGQAERLQQAGVDAYNHNLNTSEDHYKDICTTHTYEDRVNTVHSAQEAGLSACSGLIVGMGESDEQLVDAIFALKDLEGDSIPVNFLMPFDGTPLAGTWELTPMRCLRILATVRMVNPEKELRMAGGREMHLRSLQATALHVVNSLFLGDYLTSVGQSALDDLKMIRDGGFVVLGAEDRDLVAEHEEYLRAHNALPQENMPAATPCGTSGSASACGGCSSAGACGSSHASAETVQDSGHHVEFSPVITRKRGVGTDIAPNA
ncbi:biotin synthase BioB [Rothia sp. CCM 9418]|uniref:biotin synthase BioB n=1 Tax=unclassified Rothia (in: high G+C Gram-positive bacteria) TaxID=2689056 RepID=UPI003ACCB550